MPHSASNKWSRPISPPISTSAPRAVSPQKKKAKKMSHTSQPSTITQKKDGGVGSGNTKASSQDWAPADIKVLLEALLGVEDDGLFVQLEKNANFVFKKACIHLYMLSNI